MLLATLGYPSKIRFSRVFQFRVLTVSASRLSARLT